MMKMERKQRRGVEGAILFGKKKSRATGGWQPCDPINTKIITSKTITTTTNNSDKNTKARSSSFVISEKDDERFLKLRNEFIKNDDRQDIEFLKQCFKHLKSGELKGYTKAQCLMGLEKIIKKGIFEMPKSYKKVESEQENAARIHRMEEFAEKEWRKRMEKLGQHHLFA